MAISWVHAHAVYFDVTLPDIRVIVLLCHRDLLWKVRALWRKSMALSRVHAYAVYFDVALLSCRTSMLKCVGACVSVCVCVCVQNRRHTQRSIFGRADGIEVHGGEDP